MELRTGEIITIPQAAKLLHVSPSTAYRLADSGELKAFYLGKCRRTSTTACENLIMAKMAEADDRYE
ncbi:helix-turn-helix domain-containing protein [Eggerthella sinensis]|uniref:helix-turn-helix domain-containing protein n=1 Tax=Eggerthella sinensis TaxID=242230 RepID=UPI001D06C7BC|nr:helix-turn-helix domain-containing protein [Eggerthella sinensis]MCB7037894.1 helix-turn-helix domain-containing protein [Eggerthella sinensis]